MVRTPHRSQHQSQNHSAHRTALRLQAALVLSSLSLVTGMLGCGGSSSTTPPPPPPVTPMITLKAPASSNVDPGDAASLSATVANDTNADGVTWALSGTGCTGAACGTLSNSTTTAVTYTAPATVATAFTVTLTATSVANTSITATAALSVPINPVIATPAGLLAGGTIGAAYSTTLAGTGGITPYTWSITSGNLPAGLTLNAATGAITGIPTAAGSTNFTVTLTDSGAPALTATAAYTLAVVYPALAVTTTTLANGTLGTAYNATLAASGGSGTGYTWTVTSGTGLSATGLALSTGGVISGIPTAAENAVPFTVQVTDSSGNMATATLTLTIINANFQGQVLSGQQPVAGATIQIYAVGSTGNGTASTPMLTQAVTTDSAGYFAIAGLYTCGQGSGGASIAGSDQVYLVATGGTVGANTTANSSIALMTSLGNCSNLSAATNTLVNELTTVASAWALAPFATSSTNIGATATNTLGIDNAFLDAALLANPATGSTPTLPANLAVESAKLNALADVLASCVDSDGGANCGTLFTAATPATGTAPIDTLAAALNIVKNPGQNVAAVYAAIGATPPYATTFTASPNDWTMSLTVTGGGLSDPTALGIDKQGNVWVANILGPLSAFGPQGTPLSGSTGFGVVSGVSVITDSYGLAIDPAGNVWVTNSNGYEGSGSGSITEFLGINSGTPGAVPDPTGYNTDVYYPYAIAADPSSGNLYIANEEASSATVYTDSGTFVAGYLGQTSSMASNPFDIAVDATHGFWITGSNDTVAHFDVNGNLIANIDCCQYSYGIATDASGNAWVADYLGGSNGDGAFTELSSGSNGTVLLADSTVGGINHPARLSIDAAQNVWIANLHGNSISEIAGSGGTLAPGTAISPSTGVYTTGGYGLDASLSQPFSIAPDRSGNVWVSSDTSIVMFFGVAAPTVTPLQPIPTAP